MRVLILEDANQDLYEGYLFYERQEKGLGSYFRDSMLSDIASLRFLAGIHSVHHGHHRLLTKRFPFAVYYKLLKRTVKVNAVIDCRRAPSGIRRRLK